MRVVAWAAAALLLSAADSALAMSFFSGGGGCAKGMLWPYVRNPGDCLTDAEIQAGQRGVYNGPVNTNPDLGAMAPPPPPPQSVAPAAAAPAYAAPPGYVLAPASAIQPAPMAQPLGVPAAYGPPQMVQQPGGAPVAYGPPPMVADPNIRTVTKFSCNKSALWPFVRKPGDCLTTQEKKRGETGVYGGGSGLAVNEVSVATGAPIQVQPAAAGYVVDGNGQVVAVQPAAGTYTVDSSGQVVTVAPPPAAPSCTKGALWPFVRKAGDCLTSGERNGK